MSLTNQEAVAIEQDLVVTPMQSENELQTAIMMAIQFPRDLTAVLQEIQLACNRPNFAEGAAYAFPRGGSTISGPSVKLAREMARCFGHIIYDMRVVELDDRYVHIRVMARDLQKNTAQASEDRFERKIWKRTRDADGQLNGGAWVKPDEREMRELISRRQALLERNCLLKLLPPDVVDDALQACRKTIQKAARGELEQSRSDTVRRLSVAFLEYGVNKERIEEYLAHPIEEITDAELGELRNIYTSITDGNSRPSEHFPALKKKKRERKPAPGEKVEFAKADDLSRDELEEAIKKMLDEMGYHQIELEPLDIAVLRDLYAKTLADRQDWLENQKGGSGEQ